MSSKRSDLFILPIERPFPDSMSDEKRKCRETRTPQSQQFQQLSGGENADLLTLQGEVASFLSQDPGEGARGRTSLHSPALKV